MTLRQFINCCRPTTTRIIIFTDNDKKIFDGPQYEVIEKAYEYLDYKINVFELGDFVSIYL